ncbi:phosphatase PAP2 family protein [uncultured Winogradskyella sp.]|uniref:phosphatase PAP2 family protein n=1 Tax=uncultured Winogradskyella sp. TaxID=395353 RepID=UPI00260BFD7D|nr:phosphatase PAP2 family protein [uncultured Winogradskyella sp.]
MKALMQITLLIFLSSAYINSQNTSPYNWNWNKDGIYTATALVGSATGLYLVVNKNGISEDKLNTELTNQNNINFLDRWAVGNDSETASKISDIPFYLSFAAPLVLFFDDEVNDNGGLVFGLFLKSMATTGSLYGITAGLVNKSRPYVYSNDVDINRRLSGSGQRSFFSGHTAATATATFFVAKVYQDFNPNSPGIPYVWTGAIVLPAIVGYLRIEAGQHFLTDTLIGYGIGALTGYFVPHFNKKRNESNFSLTPTGGQTLFGDNYQGIGLNYTF